MVHAYECSNIQNISSQGQHDDKKMKTWSAELKFFSLFLLPSWRRLMYSSILDWISITIATNIPEDSNISAVTQLQSVSRVSISFVEPNKCINHWEQSSHCFETWYSLKWPQNQWWQACQWQSYRSWISRSQIDSRSHCGRGSLGQPWIRENIHNHVPFSSFWHATNPKRHWPYPTNLHRGCQ